MGEPIRCAHCGREIVSVSAEALAEGAGIGDFDGALIVTSGPTRLGQIIALGGCADIGIGKQTGNPILLPGMQVSRSHCKLIRLDFGPSRWTLQDNASTNGVYVNAQRVTSHELRDGDEILIGDYEFKYRLAVEAPAANAGVEAQVDTHVDGKVGADADADLIPLAAPVAAKAQLLPKPAPAGPALPKRPCPSCGRMLAGRAKICVDCGIHIDTGKPLLMSEGLDENVVHGNAQTVIWWVSWLLWVTPLPIPLASSAYGKFKPYAIWTIAAITIVASLAFLIASWSDKDTSAKALMLWPPNVNYSIAADTLIKRLEHTPGELSDRIRQETAPDSTDSPDGQKSRDELREAVAISLRENGHSFHPWQLLTHAFLHDTGSVLGFVLHLGGNLLFLLVFGSRVNAIIGNLATAIIYPLLAIAAASLYLLSLPAGHFGPMLGASGAINGLAGMYLVLVPAHRVYCAMWMRLWTFWLLFRSYFALKIFALRGFWLLLIYLAWDTLMVLFNSEDGTAHWAHIGGFLTGVAIGLILLISRQFDCRNGDVLSLMLGKRAWPLIGKPSRWAAEANR
ncbi:MAG TPA: rhomboid family intramembrane serine protease [Tepidisphaeraceae bacterium]|nr:rhomboid family intramembrane serine protease [Tepidisphaeraceae bacterium]